MIREALSNDLSLINNFLDCFNRKHINSIGDNPYNKFVFYYQDNKCIGFMQYSYIIDRIELDYIYVYQEYRNMGIASKLMEYLINIAYKENVINISLEVASKNITAIKLYEKYGFKKSGVRCNYYKDDNGILYIKEVRR